VRDVKMVEYVKELTIVFTKQSDDIEDFDYNNLKPKFAYYLQTYHDIKMNRQYGFTEVNYGKYDKKTTKYSNKIFIDGKLALEPASVYDFNAYKAELTANGFSTTGSVSTDISSKEETWMDWAGKYVHLPNHTVSYITGGLHLHLVDNLEEGDEFTAYYRITECKRSNLTIEMKIIWKPAKRVNKRIAEQRMNDDLHYYIVDIIKILRNVWKTVANVGEFKAEEIDCLNYLRSETTHKCDTKVIEGLKENLE
jgi:hypothetical protein|tara:strand:+ start:733 stop:1488 length:756 start_codon:yes stop_codon:yes gene_type:complete